MHNSQTVVIRLVAYLLHVIYCYLVQDNLHEKTKILLFIENCNLFHSNFDIPNQYLQCKNSIIY